jgi:hypothetical protein
MMKTELALAPSRCAQERPDRASGGGGMDRSDASALADLQMHWDEAYVIGLDGNIWSARYRSSADELRAHTSSELRELIRSDYAYRQKAADLIAYDAGEDYDEEGPADGGHDSDADDGAIGEKLDGDQDDEPLADGQDVGLSDFATIRGERMST